MGGLSEYVFGYGSLACDLADVGGGWGDPTVATLHRHRRVWGVAADNSRAIPGYKRYRLRVDGSVPSVFVAFLDLEADPACAVNGVVAAVDGDGLEELDRRERNYERVEITDAIDAPVGGRVWTYVGSADGRARLEAGIERGCAVACRDYVEEVHRAFLALGGNEYERFLASSYLDGLPLADLERVDLPPEASAP